MNETDSIMVYTSGLNDIFVYTNGTQSKCENTNLIEIINSDVLGTVFSYKSSSDRWREISFNSLNNFNLRIVKSDACLFINLMYTIKFKLVE